MPEGLVFCECGHEESHHKWNPEDPLHVPWRQRTHGGRGKTTWLRHCRGNKGYDTLMGETPCRCKGFKEKKDAS